MSEKVVLPPALQELRQKARDLHTAGKLDAAIDSYRIYLHQVPGDASSWSNLGVALRSAKHFEAAIAAQRRAIELSPDEGGYWSNLGNALKDVDRVEESIAAHVRAVSIGPKEATWRHNLSVSYREAARFEEALTELDKTIRLAPREAKFRWDRGYALLHLQRFPEAWIAYEWRYRLPEVGGIRRAIPRWLGEPFAGKRLMITPEQGFGDTIFACRFLPLVKAGGGTVMLATKPALQPLFKDLAGVDEVVGHDGAVKRFDYHCSLMDLPRIFEITPQNAPPPARFSIPEEARAKARSLLARAKGRFKVGIVWSGSVTFKNNRKRAVAVERFLPFAEIPGVQLVSLQKGPMEQDLDKPGIGALMIDAGRQVENFAETAAVIDELDLVIMTDSSVAHLACSLGKPVWNLLNFLPYWLYDVKGETTPWYPTMRLFRQPKPGAWDPVFLSARKELARLLEAWRAARSTKPQSAETA